MYILFTGTTYVQRLQPLLCTRQRGKIIEELRFNMYMYVPANFQAEMTSIQVYRYPL